MVTAEVEAQPDPHWPGLGVRHTEPVRNLPTWCLEQWEQTTMGGRGSLAGTRNLYQTNVPWHTAISAEVKISDCPQAKRFVGKHDTFWEPRATYVVDKENTMSHR